MITGNHQVLPAVDVDQTGVDASTDQGADDADHDGAFAAEHQRPVTVVDHRADCLVDLPKALGDSRGIVRPVVRAMRPPARHWQITVVGHRDTLGTKHFQDPGRSQRCRCLLDSRPMSCRARGHTQQSPHRHDRRIHPSGGHGGRTSFSGCRVWRRRSFPRGGERPAGSGSAPTCSAEVHCDRPGRSVGQAGCRRRRPGAAVELSRTGSQHGN